jgi:hypothetical protein
MLQEANEKSSPPSIFFIGVVFIGVYLNGVRRAPDGVYAGTRNAAQAS